MKERKQFNFAPRWKEFLRGRPRKKKSQWILGFFACILAGALLFLPWAGEFYLDNQLKEVSADLSAYQEIAQANSRREMLNAELARQDGFLQMVHEKQLDPEQLLSQIMDLLPPETRLTSFALQEERTVQLNIVLSGPADVARLWVSLRDSGMFENFDLTAVSLLDQSQPLSLSLKLK